MHGIAGDVTAATQSEFAGNPPYFDHPATRPDLPQSDAAVPPVDPALNDAYPSTNIIVAPDQTFQVDPSLNNGPQLVNPQSTTSSFQPTVPALPNGDFPLPYNNAEEARSHPHPRQLLIIPNDDVEDIKRRQPEFVRQFMSALDSHSYLHPRPGQKKRTLAGEELQAWDDEWNKWQAKQHDLARGLIDADHTHITLEKRAWMIIEELIACHEGGVRTYPGADTTTIC